MEIQNFTIRDEIKKLINQTFKLLPLREEGEDWIKPLNTITEELAGMGEVLIMDHSILFPLLCKLEGLKTLSAEDSFLRYRSTIFECISLLSELQKNVFGDSAS